MIAKPNRDRKAERREATKREILEAAWDAAHETSIAGLTLRDIAVRVGMQQPSLYSHFASKEAIYDAMFRQAWQTCLDSLKALDLPAEPRARLIAIAEGYFDFAVADPARHQLMDVIIIPGFRPSPQAHAPVAEARGLLLNELRGMGITSDQDADIYTALIGGMISAQLAHDPGGQRWRRLIPRVINMFADGLTLADRLTGATASRLAQGRRRPGDRTAAVRASPAGQPSAWTLPFWNSSWWPAARGAL